ncbi:hypothetical protein ACEWY4_024264 [Coilia grayii]|uniref:RRM domain-containing protein n=1 Tax=Coilia grayii TaxID=363190 RepID=A0ABD1IZW4_9TELE
MEGITIEVCGVPDLLPADRTVDKLTIHFLRPRNGGGEVVRVIYPTSAKGQAFVVFELKEVAARVASSKQTLDIDGQRFPLTVGIVDRAEVDLPVQATLDLNKFSDPSEVRQLLRKHYFNVSELSSGKVLLEGTFLSLRAVRAQLCRLLQQGTEHSTNRERSVSASSGTVHDVCPKKSTTLPHVNGTHGCGDDWTHTNSSQRHLSTGSSSVSRSPLGYDSSSASSDQSLSSSHRSRERVRSYHGNHSHSLQNSDTHQSLFPSDTLTSKPPLQRRTLSARETYPMEISFQVDTDVFRYTCSFRKDLVDNILKSYGVEVTLYADSGITTLTLKGKDCETAKQKLQDLINQTSIPLRTQEILLTELSHDEAVQIAKRIQMYKDVYNVLVRQSGNSVVIIGSSEDSYEMKQRLLGKSVDLLGSARIGRGTERGPRMTRSSSLPKQPKVRPEQGYNTRLNSSSGPSSMAYSPFHYQDDKHLGGAGMSHRRTSSETREKIMSRRPVPKEAPQDLGPSSGGKAPQLKKTALNLSPAAITEKFKSLTGKRSSKS